MVSCLSRKARNGEGQGLCVQHLDSSEADPDGQRDRIRCSQGSLQENLDASYAGREASEDQETLQGLT